MKTAFLLMAFWLVVSTATAQALEVTSKTTLADHLYALYSPAVSPNGRLWLAGWRKPADNGWRDMIFVFDRDTEQFHPRLRFDVYSVNDPAFIQTQEEVLLYFTIGGLGIGVARKVGQEWQSFKVLADTVRNSLDGCQGGSPGVVVVPDQQEIWVYWHGAFPCFTDYRQRFAANGMTALSAPERLDAPWGANLDVAQRPNGLFLMAADFPLRLLESGDGLHWTLYSGLPDGVLLPAGGLDWNVTPHLAEVTNSGFTLYFSHTTCICWEAINNREWSLEKWTLQE